MKIKKLLCSLALASTVSMSLTPIASCSCVNKYSSQVQSVVNKLVEMDKYPRCTSLGNRSNLDAIRVWIIKEAIASNVPYTNIHTDEYGNIWFDVPATNGYETYKPLVLQGHMDMVVAGLTDELKTKTPIDVEVDWNKGIVHSKDYKTSIGADNGVSLAIIFTLLQDPDFKHGWLRIIFTADEDSGMKGAENITNTSTQYIVKRTSQLSSDNDIEYLLNIDAESVGEIDRSCFGSETYTFADNEFTIETKPDFENHLCLDIKGLKGGHSGSDIALKRASAEKMIYEILHEASKGQDFQIIKHFHPNEKEEDISYQRNQIVPHAQLWFNSNLTKEVIQTTIDKLITKWKTIYTGEDWDNVKITLKTMTHEQDHTKYMTKERSATIINKLGGNTDPTTMSEDGTLWYGSQTNDKGEVIKSANISPVEIKCENDKFKFKIVSQFRAKTNDILTQLHDYYEDIELIATPTHNSYYPAWEYDSGKQSFINKIADLYKKEGIEPKILDSTGGMEPAYWVNCNENLNCASIGPTIDGAHSVKETLHIDSIQPVLNVVKHVCELMKN